MPLTLRTYQQQAITDLRGAYRNGAHAPLLVLPTGGGKTCIFSAIAHSSASRGNRVLILVHRRELIAQASSKLTWLGLDHGIIAAGHTPSSSPVQVASVQTLVRRLPQLDWQPHLIIIDEAHHSVAGSWAAILNHWPDAYRLGVSATPVRLDGRGLGESFDALITGPSVADLTHLNFLAPSRVYAPPVVADLDGIKARAGDFAVDQAAERMDRPTVTGDAIAHYQRLGAGQRAIVFTCNTKHAESVCSAFKAAGINAATLLGTTSNRDQLVADFAASRVQVLVTVDVVSEGFDCPGATCAVLLRPTKSESLYLQQVGRVLRPAPGKSHAIILDHVGNVHRHGFPDDHRDWTLDDARRRTRAGGPAAPAVRTCPQCFAAFKPQPLCPCCGAISAPIRNGKIRQVAGELQELKRVNAQLRAEEQRGRRRQQATARTLPELMAIAKQRGYSPAWAWKVHNARSRSA